jgi:hypothetical protein
VLPTNGFEQASLIGSNGVNDLLPLLERESFQGRFVITDKGNLSEFLQKSVGDVIFNCKNQKVWTIEIKTEKDNKTGNFYLETWSNLSRYTPGWLQTLKTDFLWYYFQSDRLLYSILFAKLREWAFKKQRIYVFPERKQAKYNQLNDTWGRCVPISIIEKEVGLKLIPLPVNSPRANLAN